MLQATASSKAKTLPTTPIAHVQRERNLSVNF
jgi:hypothetical protein